MLNGEDYDRMEVNLDNELFLLLDADNTKPGHYARQKLTNEVRSLNLYISGLSYAN